MSGLVRAGSWVALLVGMLCMGPALIDRAVVEQSNATFELSIPSSEVTELLRGGLNADAVYEQLTDRGLQSVDIEMQTIPGLELDGQLSIMNRTDLLPLVDEPASLRADATFLLLAPEASGVLERIERAAPAAQIDWIEVEGRRVYQVIGAGDLSVLPLGYDDAEIRWLIDRGLDVIARVPATVPSFEFATEELKRIRDESGVNRVLFSGETTPFAHDSGLMLTFAEWLRDEGFTVLTIEFAQQLGVATYATIAERVIRLHGLNLAQEPDPESSVDRAIRAVKERNVRILLLRPTDVPLAQQGLDELTTVMSGISEHMPPSFRLGVAEPFGRLGVTPLLMIGGIISAAALAAVTGALVGPLLAVALGALVGLLALAGTITGSELLADLLRLALAILAAILAVFVVRPRAGIGAASIEYLKAGLVVLLGGLMLSGFAYDTSFLVAAQGFWGVKALLLAPLLIAGVVALYQSLGRPRLTDARAALETPIRLWHIGAFVAIVGVLGYLLLRSDNTGVATDVELAFRQQLEDLLYVRPRTKEFAIGFPALLVGCLLAWRSRHGWWFYPVAAIGTSSAIDTFAHFHAPLLASVLRTVYGLALGYGFGLVAIAAIAIITRMAGRVRMRAR